ncbi:hypothetical protein CDL12_00972 [Handroanthus impetiginosus]|uniref:Uncharacterized protein n=1 Tax=Handroanthus impetiginosus TaxID=429701 RepID=A0A2G9I938_9LAMI|nr:hypothetical protein CDL12_00972 [Handroanthus impetiginosus]
MILQHLVLIYPVILSFLGEKNMGSACLYYVRFLLRYPFSQVFWFWLWFWFWLCGLINPRNV